MNSLLTTIVAALMGTACGLIIASLRRSSPFEERHWDDPRPRS